MTIAEGVKYERFTLTLWVWERGREREKEGERDRERQGETDRQRVYTSNDAYSTIFMYIYIHMHIGSHFVPVCASYTWDPHRQKVCHVADNVNNYLVDNNRCVQLMQIDVCEYIRTRYRSINYSYLRCRCCPGNITFLTVRTCTHTCDTCHRRGIPIERFLRIR